MKEEAKEARRKYEREYYAKNKEKMREKQRRYWEKKAESIVNDTNMPEKKKEDKKIQFYIYWRSEDGIRVFTVTGKTDGEQYLIDKKEIGALLEVVSYDDDAIVSIIDPYEMSKHKSEGFINYKMGDSWRVLQGLKEVFMIDETNLATIKEKGRAGWYFGNIHLRSMPLEFYEAIKEPCDICCPSCGLLFKVAEIEQYFSGNE